MDIEIRQQEEYKPESVSLKNPKKVVVQKEYKTETVSLSKNIQKFDNKDRTVRNPYDYNTVSLHRPKVLNPNANDLLSSDLYNSVGKFLGVDNVREWNQMYDKVFKITEWAKEQTKSEDKHKIMKYIMSKENKIPSLSGRRINDIFIYINL